jgi:signal transduction histidine kinase
MSIGDLEERVIICVESAQDAVRIIDLLGDFDIKGISCSDQVALSEEIEQGAAAVIISASPRVVENFSDAGLFPHSQPAWSALPTILIVEDSGDFAAIAENLPLGVTLLERPVRMRTLANVTRMALNSRRNQYMIRNLLHEREALIELLNSEAKMKNEFLATLAHELRNPLAPIRTGLRILQLSPSSTAAPQALEMMERQVSHLVRLIDDLLDISRITSGRLEVRKQKVSLASLLSDAVETSRPFIDVGTHTLTVVKPDEPITLDVDPTRIAQVISNLLNNAAKYTPHGGAISLTATRKDNTIQIEVKDNGIGLAQDMLSKIFGMFSQVAPVDSKPQSGLGIGLSLARRLTEMHGGTLEAASPGPGKGSSFTVTLPYDGS